MNISCSKTGYSSSITFHTKPMYGGVRDHITGEVKHLPSGRVVCRINGQWTEKVEMTFPDKEVGCSKLICPEGTLTSWLLLNLRQGGPYPYYHTIHSTLYYTLPHDIIPYYLLVQHLTQYHTIPYNTMLMPYH